MQLLSPEKILAVWETGRDQHELDRALTLLAAGHPELSHAELAALSIGERDARLLRLRARMLGAHAKGFAACPACTARLEFDVDTNTFEQRPASSAEPPETTVDGRRVRFRAPTSLDLAEIVAAPDAGAGLRRLVERCIVGLDADVAPNASTLPLATLETLSAAILRADPQAEITLALQCPDCGHRWESLFDVAAFFWRELAAHARRLLREIDAIARAYGWSEREILTLSAPRRQTYLEMITA